MASDTACGTGIEGEKSRPGRTRVINHIPGRGKPPLSR